MTRSNLFRFSVAVVGLLSCVVARPLVSQAIGMHSSPCLFTPTCRPPFISLKATPNPISDGQSALLSWNILGAKPGGISIDQDIGAVSSSGSQTVTPADTTTYTLTATGIGGTMSQSVVLAVQPSVTLTATPTTVQQGASSVLAWTTKHAVRLTIVDGSGNTIIDVVPSVGHRLGNQPVGPKVDAGTVTVSPTNLTTYTATATGLTGLTTTASTTITQSHTKVSWTLVDTSQGSLVVDPTKTASATFSPAPTATPGLHPKLIQADITYFLAPGAAAPFVSLTKYADVCITPSADCSGGGSGGLTSGVIGDVYSGGSVSNLTVDPKSVVSAAGAIAGVTGTSFQIPSYTTSNSLQWTTARQSVLDQATRLKNEHLTPGRTLSATGDATISGNFNLNPVGSTLAAAQAIPTINSATPEGQVWFVGHDLTIDATKGPVTFYGRGTIIVDGSVKLIGSHPIIYACPPLALAGPSTDPDCIASGIQNPKNTASLGIIVTKQSGGGVTVDPNLPSIVGAYFAAGTDAGTGGTIDFSTNSTNPIRASGLFVGAAINLVGRPIGTISYDPRIGTLTPPGFGVVSAPGIKETAP